MLCSVWEVVKKFQSLFSWISTGLSGRMWSKSGGVSILVFLDFNQGRKEGDQERQECFNPCFLGFQLSLVVLSFRRVSVSILVFLDFNTSVGYLTLEEIKVSILVFLDFNQALQALFNIPQHVSILVFLDFNFSVRVRRYARYLRFNPCFLGFQPFSPCPPEDKGFVSILVFLDFNFTFFFSWRN